MSDERDDDGSYTLDGAVDDVMFPVVRARLRGELARLRAALADAEARLAAAEALFAAAQEAYHHIESDRRRAALSEALIAYDAARPDAGRPDAGAAPGEGG